MGIKIHPGINYLNGKSFSTDEIVEVKPGEYCQTTKNQTLKTTIPNNCLAIGIMAKEYNFLGNIHINEAGSVIEHLDKDNSFDDNEKIAIILRADDFHFIRSILEQNPQGIAPLLALLKKFEHKNIELRIGSAIEITKEGEVKEDRAQNELLSDFEKSNILQKLGVNYSATSFDESMNKLMKSCCSLLDEIPEEDGRRELRNLVHKLLAPILEREKISLESIAELTQNLTSKETLEGLPHLLEKSDALTAQQAMGEFIENLREIKKRRMAPPEGGG